MEIFSPTLYLEINKSEYIFTVGDKDENNNFKLIYKSSEEIQGINNYKITDFDLISNIIKKNIFIIEKKINFVFKDIILIIDTFNCSYVNLTGYKKLNSSQILKENITYILNSLKSNIDKFESQKKIIHIFNSKYCLDKEEFENLPIGLYGDFYSQELSFILLNNNDYKNLNKIFEICNLKIKKVLIKSFIEGSHLSDSNLNLKTFFQVKINSECSKISYFENDALKIEQNFNFGSDIILNDIAKITSLNKVIIKKFLDNQLNKVIQDDELIEDEYFEKENYIKIKKKLIFEIASARIQEFAEIFITKNINISSYQEKNRTIFLYVNDKSNFAAFKESYGIFFSKMNFFQVRLEENISTNNLINCANKLAHFGWKKEAVPVSHPKKSTIARFFDKMFG